LGHGQAGTLADTALEDYAELDAVAKRCGLRLNPATRSSWMNRPAGPGYKQTLSQCAGKAIEISLSTESV